MLDINHTILDVQGNEIISIEDNPLVPSILKYGTVNLEEKKLDLINLSMPLNSQLSNSIVSEKLTHIPSNDPVLKPPKLEKLTMCIIIKLTYSLYEFYNNEQPI